ncbi:Protein ltv1 [Quaeritorhiza haematococci]|nr:Protein ltv1 [Quaeritorhiza haematococci]
MGKKPFIDRKRARHFHLVHRSQRDPLLADETASKLVLKEVAPSRNLVKKGKYDPVEFEDSDVDDGEYLNSDEEEYLDVDEDELFSGEEGEDGSDEQEDGEEGADEEEEEGEESDVDGETQQSKQRAAKGKEPVKAASRKAGDGKRSKQDEASIYGIFFNDQDEYDYLQHLKPMGEDPSAVFIEPKKPAVEEKKKGGISFKDEEAVAAMNDDDTASVATTRRKKKTVTFDLPSDVLPSVYEEDVGLLNKAAMSSGGLNLDLSDEVREVLSALEDDAYVAEDAEDFFAHLDADEVPEGLVPDEEYEEEDDDEEDWYKQFKKYKKDKQNAQYSDDEDDFEDDDDEAQSDARSKASVRSRKSAKSAMSDRRTATTTYSMTSSAMFRNSQLTLLDDRFDRILEEYTDDEIGELDPEDPEVVSMKNAMPQEYLDKIFDDFLESTVGILPRVGDEAEEFGKPRKWMKKDKINALKKVLRTKLGTEVMDSIRKSLRDGRDTSELVEEIQTEFLSIEGESKRARRQKEEEAMLVLREKEEDRWDCETILTTYSNIYNRPKVIRDALPGKKDKIRLGKNGMPFVEKAEAERENGAVDEDNNVEQGEEDEVSDSESQPGMEHLLQTFGV